MYNPPLLYVLHVPSTISSCLFDNHLLQLTQCPCLNPVFTGDMDFRKFTSLGGPCSSRMMVLPNKVPGVVGCEKQAASHAMEDDVDIDLREVYFLILHFLSGGPCHRTFELLQNELLEHQLLPRRYHALFSRTNARSGSEDDDGTSFPLNYSNLVDR